MKPLLILIQPLDVAANARIDIYLGSAMSGLYLGAGGHVWEPALRQRPRISFQNVSVDLSGKIQVGKADFSVNLSRIKEAVKNPFELDWTSAPVTIWDNSANDWPNSPIEFKGTVKSPVPDLDNDGMTLNCEVDVSRADKPLLYLEFTGAGGINGDAELRGTRKPAGFGANVNCKLIFFDKVRNIGMIDGYGNTISIEGVFENLSDMGPSVGNFGTYAALADAIDTNTVPEGRWATCIAEGLVGMGAPPVGVITVDATFGHDRTGDLIQHVLQNHAGIAAGDIAAQDFIDVDAAVDRPIRFWTSSQRGSLNFCEALAGGINSTLLCRLDGKFSIARAFGGATIGTLDRFGTSVPEVRNWKSGDVIPPLWRMTVRCAQPGYVNDLSEVSYEDDLIDRGEYNPATSYKDGDLVWDQYGAQWLFINATPTAGATLPVEPETSNSHWELRVPRTSAANLFYEDGSPIEQLKPLTFYQATPPSTAATNTGNRWVDTSDGQREYMREDYTLTFSDTEVTFGGFSLSFVWLEVGDHTADNTTENQIVIDYPVDRIIKCASDGTPLPDVLPDIWSIRVMRGGTSLKLSADVTYAIDAAGTSNVTATIEARPGSIAKGDVTVTAMSANTGTVSILVTVNGKNLPLVRVRYIKELALLQATGGSGAKKATVDASVAVSGTSYALIAPVSTVTLAASERIVVTAPLDYNVGGNSSATRSATLKHTYKLLPSGTETDFDPGIAGSIAESGYNVTAGGGGYIEPEYLDPVPGHVDANQTETGLAAGDYEVRTYAKLDATGRQVTFFGTINIEAKL